MREGSTFIDRVKTHEEFAVIIDGFLARAGFTVERQGVERLTKMLRFIEMHPNDDTARFARFQPDGIAANDSIIFYYDYKASTDIEKGPYLQYQQFQQIHHCTLFLFIDPLEAEREKYNKWFGETFSMGDQGKWFFVPISVPTNDLLLWGSKFGKPVDVDGWIALRLYNDPNSQFHDPEAYSKVKNVSGGSGTSFRTFNFKFLKENGYLVRDDDDFKRILIKNVVRA